MGIPLGELVERMSSLEFAMHQRQYQDQPWGPERDELNTAIIARTVARSAGMRYKGDPRLSEFFTYGRETLEQVEAEKQAQVATETDPVEFVRNYYGS